MYVRYPGHINSNIPSIFSPNSPILSIPQPPFSTKFSFWKPLNLINVVCLYWELHPQRKMTTPLSKAI